MDDGFFKKHICCVQASSFVVAAYEKYAALLLGVARLASGAFYEAAPEQ
jgi:hypothetical protein